MQQDHLPPSLDNTKWTVYDIPRMEKKYDMKFASSDVFVAFESDETTNRILLGIPLPPE